MTELRIRAATADDLDIVLAFWKTAAEGTSISDDRDGVEPSWRASWSAR